MTEFKKYGSIQNIKKSSEIMSHIVVITEKIHGTNTRAVWTPEEGLILGGRNVTIYRPRDGHRKHDGYNFTDWMLEDDRWEAFKKYPGYTFYGEFHGPGIQKGINYGDKKDWRIFDIRHPEGYFVNWEFVQSASYMTGFKAVPVLYTGNIGSVEQLNKLISQNSATAIQNGVEDHDNIAEGIVIKPQKETLDRRDNRLIVKYKSEKWQESHTPKVKKQLSSEEMEFQEKVRAFAESVVTPGRVATIAEHITRDGNAEVSVRRTGEFLKEFVRDVMKEYEDMYNKLDRKETNQYNKAVSNYASRQWKQYVAENG